MRQPPLNVIDAAQAAQVQTGVRASVSLGQWALESAWGEKATGRFNFFGVKAGDNQLGTMCWTHEWEHGHLVPCQARFRDYPDLETAFLDHARIFTGDSRYAAALPHLADVDAFVAAIAPVYATDPHYAASLVSVIHGNRLTAYDTFPSP